MKENEHVVICRTNGAIEDMMLTEHHDFHWLGEQIGTDIIQTVHARGLKRPYLILCDEEGLFRGRPTINFLGSWLYQTQKHGEPIVGDVMIVKEVSTPEGMDIGGMSASEAEVVVEWLLENFWEAHDQVMEKIGHKLIRRNDTKQEVGE